MMTEEFWDGINQRQTWRNQQRALTRIERRPNPDVLDVQRIEGFPFSNLQWGILQAIEKVGVYKGSIEDVVTADREAIFQAWGELELNLFIRRVMTHGGVGAGARLSTNGRAALKLIAPPHVKTADDPQQPASASASAKVDGDGTDGEVSMYPSELFTAIGCSDRTLHRRVEKLGITPPGPGERELKYTELEIVQICESFTDSRIVGHRQGSQKLLDRINSE